jgi:hypothetical protein
MYHDGFDFQAGIVTSPFIAATLVGVSLDSSCYLSYPLVNSIEIAIEQPDHFYIRGGANGLADIGKI